MSEERLYKQKFRVEQWPTSKVILYPSRASVERVINAVNLKPGLNEITISDLTSSADPDSIRVAGTTEGHPARINDLTIDHVNNPYTSDNASDTESEDESETDEEPEHLRTAKMELDEIASKIAAVAERQQSARKQLNLLEDYATSLSGSRSRETLVDPETMKKALELYNSQRASHYTTFDLCAAEDSKLQKDYMQKTKVLEKEKRAYAKTLRSKREDRKKKLAERQERRKEKLEQRPETSAQVLRVRITIEIPSPDIILARTSSDSGVLDIFQEAELSLTYTTSSASWTPVYDLRLDTTNPSLSTLTYRAHFTNRTYETWTHALITLSTSQASFGGLNEKIPQMESWRVTAGRKWDAMNAENGENGLYSLAEVKLNEATQATGNWNTWNMAPGGKPKKVMRPAAPQIIYGPPPPRVPPPPPSRLGPPPPPPQPVVVISSSPYEARRERRSRSSSLNRSRSYRGRSVSPAMRRSVSPARRARYVSPPFLVPSTAAEELADWNTIVHAGEPMQHSLAGADTYGFTTTYELPTARTIPSSPLIRRHVIAEIPLPSIAFTYIIIPKLKAAAFLKARVTNTSIVPLLPGQAGLTLDGSFMGNLAFPRCSPAETAVLALGVDQSVKVEYERPSVMHAVQGMILMGKEEVGAFKRTMRITNTKASTVSLVVLDQVPVPDDERLKVNITHPRGLKNVNDVANGVGGEGNSPKPPAPASTASPQRKAEDVTETASVKSKTFSFRKSSLTKPLPPVLPSSSHAAPRTTPEPSSASGAMSSSNWGAAKATLKKNGEVRWDVDLNKGGCVSLSLEWECRIPSGEGVQAVS
ncbi:hypothetical protein HWV62_39277 [Athelia sp. TMB]|nr:hypothetical protein HWV62_39277 [Athelia sp. TMB]